MYIKVRYFLFAKFSIASSDVQQCASERELREERHGPVSFIFGQRTG
jgi:hypothetical protein